MKNRDIKKLIIGIVLVGVGIWIFSYGLSLRSDEQMPTNDATSQVELNPETDRDPAPDFNLEDFSGESKSLSDFDGPLVINAWATWCPFCVDEIPEFAEIQAEFDGEVTFIPINRAESQSDQIDYLENRLSVATDSMVFLSDPDDSFYKSIGGISMPETIFVDSSGNIADHKRGPISKSELQEKVSLLVGEE